MLTVLAASPAVGQEVHPIMDSKWWVTAGSYFAERDFQASAGVNIGGEERGVDFEGTTGIDDSPDLFMGEIGWRFADNWNLALQHFRVAAKHYRNSEVPRACAHAFAAEGHMRNARALCDEVSKKHAERAVPVA